MTKFSIITFMGLCAVALQGCGGVIPLNWNGGWISARIAYKQGSKFSPNEFCVWTFLSEDNVGNVRIDFRQHIQESLDGIVVYTWKDSTFTSHKIPHTNSSLTVNAQQFAVAFSSDRSVESNGFDFDVFVLVAGSGATNSKAYFSIQNQGEFTYPKIIGEDLYEEDKRVSVVLHGPTETPRKFREYSLRDLDMEGNYDFVDVYILWPYDFNPLYTFVGRFSGHKSGVVANSTLITPFPVLYLFSSGRNGVGKGFTIPWKLYANGMMETGDFMMQS